MPVQYDKDTLVATLNALIESLEIPITLYDPLELTPFLILAVFESMLRTRLPIPQETRKTVTRASRIEAMKVFLGVLEDDVLGVDVGLEELDPRRLADGEEEEVIYVGEVLCWLGKKMHYITKDGFPARTTSIHREDLPASPGREPSPSTLSTSLKSALSFHDSIAESQTTIAQESFDDGTPIDDAYERASVPSYHHTDDITDSFDLTATQSRIYDVEDFPASPRKRRAERLPLSEAERTFEDDEPFASDSEAVSESFCDCPEDLSMCSTVRPPVRTDGYLSKVDVESELQSFEAWRDASTHLRSSHRLRAINKPSLSVMNTPPRNGGSSRGIITRHTSPAQHTLALMEERARLLSELAKLKSRRN